MMVVSAVFAKYEKTIQELKVIRKESRAARAELIKAILCDEKDVLAPTDMERIGTAFVRFRKVQKRLHRAFFNETTAYAKFFGQCGEVGVDLED